MVFMFNLKFSFFQSLEVDVNWHVCIYSGSGFEPMTIEVRSDAITD